MGGCCGCFMVSWPVFMGTAAHLCFVVMWWKGGGDHLFPSL